VRPSLHDGPRALQAVRDAPPRRARQGREHQGRQARDRPHRTCRVGRPRGGHQGPPRAAQPRPDAAPPLHPGIRARPRRGQGHPPAPARVRALQRGLRRRPDVGPRAAVHAGAGRGPRPHALLQQPAQPRVGQGAHRALPGHGLRRLLPHHREGRRRGRGPHLPQLPRRQERL
jgi:hypothetical protein